MASAALALTLLATTLALPAPAGAQGAPALQAGDGASPAVALEPAPPTLPDRVRPAAVVASRPPATSPASTAAPGTAASPRATYPPVTPCRPDQHSLYCRQNSSFVDATISADTVESGGLLTASITSSAPACDMTMRTGPYRDCSVKELQYFGLGNRILPEGGGGLATIEPGTDGVVCYQYVPSCQFRTTYTGELPSRWILIQMVGYQRTIDPPPEGNDYAIYSTPEGPVYQWYAIEDVVFRVVGSVAGPTADFTVTPVDGQPGTYDYVSTSTNPNGTGLTHRWTFPDGSTSSQASVRKTYTTPGDKTVTLDVATPESQTDSKTITTTVEAPELGISITLDGEPPALDVDDEVEVQIKVTAGKDGVGNLTGLKLAGPGLVNGDEDVLEVTEGVSPSPGTAFALAPGAAKNFTAKIKARSAGTSDLTATVSGKDAAARTVTKTATNAVRVRSAALKLDLELDKQELTLDEDDDGPKPQNVELTVTGTNTSDKTLTDITLLSIVPSWKTGLPFTSRFPSSILHPLDGPGNDGLPLDDLDPGEHFEKTFEVQVLDDGHLRLGIDASYSNEDGGTDLATGDVDLTSKPKYLLAFESTADASVDDNSADPWNPSDAVAAGRSFLVTGSVENLTTDQKVIATIPAENLKQVSSVNLGPLEEDWDNPGMPMRVDLDAGASQGVHARPVAIPVPAKNGALTYSEYGYAPKGKAYLREDGDLTAVPADAILTKASDRTFKVPIVWPPPEPAPTPIEFYGLFSKAFIESTAAWWANAAQSAGTALYAVGEMEANAWNVIVDPVAREAFRQQVTGAWASFVNNVELMRQTLLNLSPAERLQLIQEISNPFLLYLKVGKAIVTSDQAQAAAKAIGTAIDAAWTRITTLGGEDPRELARILGSGSATVFNEVTVGMVTDAAVAKLFTKMRYGKNLADAQKFVDEAAAAKAAEGLRIDKGLKGIPAGAALTDEVLTIGLGVTRAEKQQLLAVAKRFNLRVMARSRGSGAAELLAKGRARLKPFGVDAKNVSDLDVLLGFPASMRDTVAIKKPKAWADVLASGEYRALDAEQRAQVASRWQTRSKEWSGGGKLKETAPGEWTVAEAPPVDGVGAERAKFLKADEAGTFDLQFPTEGNWEEVATNKQAIGTARADFRLGRTTVDGDEVLQPFMSAAQGGKPLPITGDVDLVALLNPDGTYPSPEKIIAAYAELAKPPLGMQHPATWSFNIKGKSMDLLSDHVLGGATAEPLASFDPTGKITAVLFDPKMSLIPADRAANPALLIQVAGGIKLPSHAYGLGAALPVFIDSQGRPTNPYYLPEDWREAQTRAGSGSTRLTSTRRAGTEADRATAPSTSGVRFVRGAAPAEENADFTLRRFDGGWDTWSDIPAGKLQIAPQTCLADDLAAGQRTIAVYGLDQLFADSGTGGQGWFQAGDEVTVDLHGSEPWTTTIVSLTAHSVTFRDPAPRAFLPGTAVHLRLVSSDGGREDDDGAGDPSSGGEATRPAPGELARTGSSSAPLAALGALLVLAGAAFVAAGRGTRARGLHR
jgi:hypothetical protein